MKWIAPSAVAVLAFVLALALWNPAPSLSGDNGTYVLLAESLIAGDGYTIDGRLHTKFPPLFPIILAWAEWIAPGELHWKKVPAFLSFVVLAFLVTLWAGPAAGALVATSPLLLDYSDQVMAELPLALVGVWVWRWGGHAKHLQHLAATLLVLVFGFYIKTIVLAWMLGFLWETRRVWPWFFNAFAGLCVVLVLPWFLFGSIWGEGTGYFHQLMAYNPYYPELGPIPLLGFWDRLMTNLSFYLSWSPLLMALLAVRHLGGPWRTAEDFFNYRVRRDGLKIDDPLLWRLVVCYMAALMIWPWNGDRFLVPILPLLLIEAGRGLTYWYKVLCPKPPSLSSAGSMPSISVPASIDSKSSPT